jgi:hypothetical protein
MPELARYAEEALGFRVAGHQVVFSSRHTGSGWSMVPGDPDAPPRPATRPATPQEREMWALLTTPHSEWGA